MTTTHSRWNHRRHGLEFFSGIRSEVNLSTLEAGVPQPESHFSYIAGCLQGVHCTRMSQAVRRNPLRGKRRLLDTGYLNVFLQNVFETRPGHEFATSILEESCSLRLAADFEPVTKYARSLFPHWEKP